jgi:hypothetical protein
MRDYGFIDRTCVICESSFQAKNHWKDTRRTCSDRCRYEFLRRKFQQKSSGICPQCGKEFVTYPQSKQKLCTLPCKRKYVGQLHRGPDNPNWKETKYLRAANRRSLVKRIRERDKVCMDCGSAKNLHVHHIDSNPKNNADENLVLLCIPCHARRHEALGETKVVPLILVSGKPRKILEKVCMVCHKKFPPKKRRAVTCSPRCGRIQSGLSRRVNLPHRHQQLSLLLEAAYPQTYTEPLAS